MDPTSAEAGKPRQAPPTRWYQVPVLWLGLAIITLFVAAAMHMVLVSFGQLRPADNAIETERAFKGIPLTTEVLKEGSND